MSTRTVKAPNDRVATELLREDVNPKCSNLFVVLRVDGQEVLRTCILSNTPEVVDKFLAGKEWRY